MLITRKSAVSGIERTIDLPITAGQMSDYIHKNMLIQDAFPNLTADQREFILTGITQEEWDATMRDDEDEEDDSDEKAF